MENVEELLNEATEGDVVELSLKDNHLIEIPFSAVESYTTVKALKVN